MSIKNILITGTRAPASLHLARLLSGAGFNIFSAECVGVYISKYSRCFEKHYKIDSPCEDFKKFCDDIINIIQQEKIDLIIPTCEEIFYIAKAKPNLEKYCSVLCDNFDKLAKLHDKWIFSNIAFQKTKQPKSWLIKNREDLQNIIDFDQYPKYILKPRYSRFATQVQIIQDSTDLININLQGHSEYILQEFIEGQQICCYAIIKKHKVVLYSDYKTEYSANIGATIAFQFADNKEVFRFIEDFAKNEDYEGQIAFDFIKSNQNELYCLECNPRLTSGIQLFNKTDEIKRIFTSSKIGETVTPNHKTKSVLFFAMLVYGLKTCKSLRTLKKWVSVTFMSKDVVFSLKDIKPFFMQPYVLLYMIYQSIKCKISIKELSTKGIEWNGKEID